MEVLILKKNAADNVAMDILGRNVYSQDTAVLFADVNVDHNIIKIDGKHTSHDMCMIAALTPGREAKRNIPRQAISKRRYAE